MTESLLREDSHNLQKKENRFGLSRASSNISLVESIKNKDEPFKPKVTLDISRFRMKPSQLSVSNSIHPTHLNELYTDDDSEPYYDTMQVKDESLVFQDTGVIFNSKIEESIYMMHRRYRFKYPSLFNPLGRVLFRLITSWFFRVLQLKMKKMKRLTIR